MPQIETSTQIEIRESIRKLAESEIHKYTRHGSKNVLPRPLFNSFAEAGFAALNISEEYGGHGLGPIESMIVMEEIARQDLGPAIFLGVHLMVAGILEKNANTAQKQNLLPKMAEGTILGAFALTEPDAGSDSRNLKTRATRKGDRYVINGQKCYISSAGFADLYLTFANTENGICCFAVPKDSKGLSFSRPEEKIGCHLSPIASVIFDNCEVSRETLIGSEGGGHKVALSGLAGGRINIAACANGLSIEAINLALKHLKERSQFGQPLINFQGLQFMLADLVIALKAARLLTWDAAYALTNSDNKSVHKLDTSIAKCFATDTAMKVTTDAVQLLGGAGYIEDYKVGKLMRDAKMLQIVEGTNQIQRVVIAREIINEASLLFS